MQSEAKSRARLMVEARRLELKTYTPSYLMWSWALIFAAASIKNMRQ